MKRLSKEYIIINTNEIQIKIGVVDKTNPQVFYIFGKTWITPSYCGEYKNDLLIIFNNFNKNFKQFLISNNLSLKYINSFDINYNSMEIGNNNYLTFEFVIKQKNNLLSFKEIKNTLNDNLKELMLSFKNILNDNGFITNKKR